MNKPGARATHIVLIVKGVEHFPKLGDYAILPHEIALPQN